jgi:DNA-binding GntR family transcriptional regulator
MPYEVVPPLEVAATRSDRVTEAVRQAILTGGLRPGETLVERELAATLGVSKTPVREALIALTASGLVVSSPNRGVTVRTLTPKNVKEIYELRLLLEPWAVAEMTRSRTEADVARIEAALDRADSALVASNTGGEEQLDTHSANQANRALHRELYSGCANSLVVQRLDALQDLTALSILSVLWKRWPTWQDEMAEHRAIFENVKKQDIETVRRLVFEHISHSIERLGDADEQHEVRARSSVSSHRPRRTSSLGRR